MGIYYFAVDYFEEKQIWAPDKFSCKNPGIFSPNNPFPNMVIMKNAQGYNYQIIDDMYSGPEYEFEDITEQVYMELKKRFPNYHWDNKKWINNN